MPAHVRVSLSHAGSVPVTTHVDRRKCHVNCLITGKLSRDAFCLERRSPCIPRVITGVRTFGHFQGGKINLILVNSALA